MIEQKEMLNCISTNTTNFFREGHHFEYLKNKIIPEPLKDKSEKTIRIWSAGCSTGEEPYSIAIAICEALKQIPPNPPLLKGLGSCVSTGKVFIEELRINR